jgi:Uma2 family endonuclease
MGIALNLEKRYTYADYLTWVDDKLRELIDGFVHLMSPAPRMKHADMSSHIHGTLFGYIKKNRGKCKVFHAPFDVRLPNNPNEMDDNQIYTVVQPDICVICDLKKLDERGCIGAPDMIVEILSISTQKYDLNEKFYAYESAGVKEYWVVSQSEGVTVYLLQENGKYDDGTIYQDKAEVPVKTLSGLYISLKELYSD